MTEVRKFLDSRGIKPDNVTQASCHRLYALQIACIQERFFGDNMREFSRLVSERLKKVRGNNGTNNI